MNTVIIIIPYWSLQGWRLTGKGAHQAINGWAEQIMMQSSSDKLQKRHFPWLQLFYEYKHWRLTVADITSSANVNQSKRVCSSSWTQSSLVTRPECERRSASVNLWPSASLPAMGCDSIIPSDSAPSGMRSFAWGATGVVISEDVGRTTLLFLVGSLSWWQLRVVSALLKGSGETSVCTLHCRWHRCAALQFQIL